MNRLAPVALAALLLALVASAFAGDIHPALERALSDAAEDSLLRVYAVFENPLSAETLVEGTRGTNPIESRILILALLKEHARASQARVRAALASDLDAGRAIRPRTIWMANVLALQATPAVVRKLASFDEIRSLHLDAIHGEEVFDAPEPRPLPAPSSMIDPPLQPGLMLIHAQDAWDLGVTGAGVVVASIDTGCDFLHPDLVNRMWTNPAEDLNHDGRFTPADINGIDDDGNGYVDDVIGYDFGSVDPNPMDLDGHGTLSAGQIVGDGTSGLRTGVAPGAKLMVLKAWDNSGSSESMIWEAMQYAVDNGANLTTSSLSWKWDFNPKPNYPVWRQMTDIELAVGIAHTNSIGNQGGSSSYPIPYNVATPGNCPPAWLHPGQTLVGGLSSVIGCGNVSALTDVIEGSSGRGPSAWEDIQANHPEYPYAMPVEYQDYPYETIPGSQGLLKPDVSAPGADTESTAAGGGYATFGGTSSATPHTAGTAALVLSVDPTLTPGELSRILQLSSIEKGTAGKDNEYGAGRIDALRAVLAAQGNLGPTINSINLTALPMYQENALRINGTEFLGDVEVEFDGLPAASVVPAPPALLFVQTPVFPVWDTVDVTVRTAFGEDTLTDALEFHGTLFLDSASIHVGQPFDFHLLATPSARWGYLVNTQLTSCEIKGIPFQVCKVGRIGDSRDEVTDATGFGPASFLVPSDPTLVGKTLYLQAGIDGNGTAPLRDWKSTNVISGPILP